MLGAQRALVADGTHSELANDSHLLTNPPLQTRMYANPFYPHNPAVTYAVALPLYNITLNVPLQLSRLRDRSAQSPFTDHSLRT